MKNAGKVEFYKDKQKKYRWRLKASNGRIIADSGQGYKAKESCFDGWRAVVGLIENCDYRMEVSW